MSLERFDRLVDAQLAHVNLLVRTAAGERCVGLPIDVKRRRRMEGELLGAFAGRCVPNDGRAIDLSERKLGLRQSAHIEANMVRKKTYARR